jgi:hypothetical protein
MTFPFRDTEAALMAAEIREQIYEDFRSVVGTNEPKPYTPPAPMPTYEEMTEQLHRAANPTPADVAARMLNQQAQSGAPPWSWEWVMGEPLWLEMRRAMKRVKREAPAYAPLPESVTKPEVLDLVDLRDAGYELLDVTADGVVTLRSPHTVRAVYMTATIR